MLKTKERASSSRALVQKIWNHIKYRSRGYGTPDYQEGFLGIDTMGWMNFQSKMHHIVHTCKWKSRAIKARIKTLFACVQFWKLPKVIEQFQATVYQAERDLNEQYDKNSNLEEQLESAVEQIIEERWDNGQLNAIIKENYVNPKKGTNFLDETHEDYLSNLSSICFVYEDTYGLRVPDQFLSDKEAEDRMWEGFDHRYDYHFDAVDDFDYFRLQIDKTFYDYSKIWNEELLPKYEQERKDKEEAEADRKETKARLKKLEESDAN
jgi:hypothetical protein